MSEEGKRMRLNMLVESSVYMMAINETIHEQLNLPFVEKRKAQIVGKAVVEYDVLGPVRIHLPTGQPFAMLCANDRLKSQRNFILYLAAPFEMEPPIS